MLGAYRKVRELWHGSKVWQAEDTRSGRTVAMYRYEVGPDQHETFLDRARALADVRHPNIVGVHVFGLWEGNAWLVTEFVEGVTLAELTAEGGVRLPYWMLTSVANQVAQCLTVVHGHGLAHGRLTPNCLLLCPDGTVKVTRFALERTRTDSESRDLNDLGRLLSESLGGAATAEHLGPADTELPGHAGPSGNRSPTPSRISSPPISTGSAAAGTASRPSPSTSTPRPPVTPTDTVSSARCGSPGMVAPCPSSLPRNRRCCACFCSGAAER